MSKLWSSYNDWLQNEIKNAAGRLADGHGVRVDQFWQAFDDVTVAHPDREVEAQVRSIRALERVVEEEKEALARMLVRKHESDLARELEIESVRQVVGWLSAVLRLVKETQMAKAAKSGDWTHLATLGDPDFTIEIEVNGALFRWRTSASAIWTSAMDIAQRIKTWRSGLVAGWCLQAKPLLRAHLDAHLAKAAR